MQKYNYKLLQGLDYFVLHDYRTKSKTNKVFSVRLSAQQDARYYARPYTARKRAGHKNVLYADTPQATGD